MGRIHTGKEKAIEKPQATIDYRQNTVRNDFVHTSVIAHTFIATQGPTLVKTPEHSIFLIESDVTSKDVWEGVANQEQTWRTGDVQFLPAGTEIAATCVSRNYSETLIRIPDFVFAAAAMGLADLNLAAIPFSQVHSPHVFGLSLMLRRLATGANSPDMLIEAMTMTLAVSILCGLSPLAARESRRQTAGLSSARRQRALEFIEQNLSRPMLLSEIAEASALSSFHFSRSFKIAMGVSPVRYVLMRRIEMSRKMLKTTSLPVSAIALACGFSSQSHFATAFKQSTSMTPAVFRRAMS